MDPPHILFFVGGRDRTATTTHILHARLRPTRFIAGASFNHAMHDHYWLYNAPSTADSVAWSEDNVIAVANRHCVTLLDPNQLDGPR